ncbi:MAG: glycoside hydrolase family 76 protein, partial [Cellulomonadaceae bacterium]
MNRLRAQRFSARPPQARRRVGLASALVAAVVLAGPAAAASANSASANSADVDPLRAAESMLLEFYANGIEEGWEDASAVSTLLAFHETTGDAHALKLVTDFFDERLDDPDALQNDFSDDTAWWGIAAVDAYRVTGDDAYLEVAQRLSDYIEEAFGDPAKTCNGGVQWRLGHAHVATISTTLTIQLDAALAQYVDDDIYLERAIDHRAWLDEIGMFAEDGTL